MKLLLFIIMQPNRLAPISKELEMSNFYDK